jgi:hypothetical protein
LQSDINDVVTTLQLGTGQAAAYVGEDWVRIGDEVMEVTNVNVGLDQLTVTRATLPAIYPADVMEAELHKEDDVVQVCKYFDGVRVDELVRQLLVNWAGIDSSYITFADWQAEADDWLSAYVFSGLITKPTGVKNLLEEISRHSVLLWWDERTQKFKFKALQPFPGKGVPIYSDANNIIADSVSLSRDPSMRASQVWFYYGVRNPVLRLDETRNYANLHLVADLDSEAEEQYGEKQLVKIYSRWVRSTGLGIAIEVAGRYLAEYRNTKTLVRIKTDIKDDSRWTGDQIILQTRYYQSDEGDDEPQPFQIIEAAESGARNRQTQHTLTCQASRNRGRCCLISASPFPDYLDADEDERLYGFVSTSVGRMSNGDIGYVIC